ncbi:MAG: hypothetical protein P1P87_09170 [Trueperaceae bacterium]|nr:hypothetical protein [Trueperaceae bacterium]
MAHPLSGLAAVLGLVAIALTTAFSAPREPVASPVAAPSVDLFVNATVEILDAPRVVTGHVEPLHGPEANPVFSVRATAYNSLVSQTNAQPHVTATGARTRWGILAVSRDLLGTDLPYGSLVRLRDLGSYASGRGAGQYDHLLEGLVFTVEDTMHPRKVQQVDLWFAEYADALKWGVRRLEVELVRYGRTGPTLDPFANATGFDAEPTWLATR